MTDSHAADRDSDDLECGAPDRRALPPRDVLFLLLSDVVLMDLAGPLDAFRAANAESAGSYRLRFITSGHSVAVAGGLTLSGCGPLPRELAPDTILVVPGVADDAGPINPREPVLQRAIEWLHSAALATQLLCVSSGAVLAAHASLLSGRQCTTHPARIAELRLADPRARVLDNRIFVEDGSVFTSAGVTAGVDLALHVIGRQLGARVAASIARRLIVYLARDGTDPALSPWVTHRDHLHPAVHRVQDAVRRDPTARWSAADLAAAACTSGRNLSRLFREHAGCSPLHYVQQIRLALARHLVMQSRLDLKSVAARTGFRSGQHLSRVWSRWEERPPSAFRSDITRSPQATRASPAALLAAQL
jgi:transcriptional regulator GlxA family with amidase domain